MFTLLPVVDIWVVSNLRLPDKFALNMYIRVFGHMFSFSQVQNSRLMVFFF